MLLLLVTFRFSLLYQLVDVMFRIYSIAQKRCAEQRLMNLQ